MALSVEVQLRAIIKVNQSPLPPPYLGTEIVDFNFNRGDTAQKFAHLHTL